MTRIQQITNVLQGWLAERAGAPVDPDQRYLEMGALDSYHVMELVIFAETNFGLMFSSEDLASPEFGTISGLARLIASKTAEA